MNNRLAVAVGAAAALALMAPTVAQAEVDHWIKCPTCESTGNSTYGTIFHAFTVATSGAYDFWGEATAEGNFTFYLYDTAPAIGAMTPPAGYVVTFGFDSGVDPHQYIATRSLLAGTTYYSAVAGECVKAGQGCNVNLIIVDNGVIPDATVPEPASMLLLGSGLLGLAGAVRRRRKQQS